MAWWIQKRDLASEIESKSKANEDKAFKTEQRFISMDFFSFLQMDVKVKQKCEKWCFPSCSNWLQWSSEVTLSWRAACRRISPRKCPYAKLSLPAILANSGLNRSGRLNVFGPWSAYGKTRFDCSWECQFNSLFNMRIEPLIRYKDDILGFWRETADLDAGNGMIFGLHRDPGRL